MSLPDINKYANTYRKALEGNPNDGTLNCSVAMCYLKLGMHERALGAFEITIASNFDNSEAYFYAAVCLFGGRKPFLATRPTIDKALEHINAALMIEPRGIYHYFMAFVKYDYFTRKCFKIIPDHTMALSAARQAGLSDHDISQLHEILRVARPLVL